MIYYHGDKKYPGLVGIGLSKHFYTDGSKIERISRENASLREK